MCQNATISISILAYTTRNGGLENLSTSDLSAAISKQLDGFQDLLLSQGKVSSGTAFNFKPPGSCHYYIFLYPLPKENAKVWPHLINAGSSAG